MMRSGIQHLGHLRCARCDHGQRSCGLRARGQRASYASSRLIKAPASFRPACSLQPSSSSALFEAARRGVSIVSLHTNLDRSREARDRLPSLVGMAVEALWSIRMIPSGTAWARWCAPRIGPCARSRLRAPAHFAANRAYGGRSTARSGASPSSEAPWETLASLPSCPPRTRSSAAKRDTTYVKTCAPEASASSCSAMTAPRSRSWIS